MRLTKENHLLQPKFVKPNALNKDTECAIKTIVTTILLLEKKKNICKMNFKVNKKVRMKRNIFLSERKIFENRKKILLCYFGTQSMIFLEEKLGREKSIFANKHKYENRNLRQNFLILQ